MLASATALGFGAFFKRQHSKNEEEKLSVEECKNSWTDGHPEQARWMPSLHCNNPRGDPLKLIDSSLGFTGSWLSPSESKNCYFRLYLKSEIKKRATLSCNSLSSPKGTSTTLIIAFRTLRCHTQFEISNRLVELISYLFPGQYYRRSLPFQSTPLPHHWPPEPSPIFPSRTKQECPSRPFLPFGFRPGERLNF